MATKTVYQTDPANGIYLFPTQANELAFAPGLFNIPFGSYEDAPSEAEPGHVAQRDNTGAGWIMVEDHREDVLYQVNGGTQYLPGSIVDIDGHPMSYPGWGKVPAWLTLTPPSSTTEAGE